MSGDDAVTVHVLNLLDCLWSQYSLFTSPPATPPIKKSSSDDGSPTSVLLLQENTTSCPSKSSSSSSLSNSRKKMMRRRNNSRSLSELELKGFMDLGFVFQDHQTTGDSKLLLSSGINGACLSETWDDCLKHQHRRRRHHHHQVKTTSNSTPLMVGLISLGGNEVELKHQIRVWAHSVASTVKS